MKIVKNFCRFLLVLSVLILFLFTDSYSQTFLKSVWNHEYDVAVNGKPLAALKADDGSFIMSGETVSGTESKILIMKISPDGKLVWQKSLGAKGNFNFRSVCKSRSEGFFILGIKQDNTNKKFIWVSKVDGNGTLLWESLTAMSENDNVTDIQETADFGVFVCGSKEIKGDRNTDAWLIKFNRKGTVESQALFGGRYINDEFNSLTENNQGGYILAGFTSSKIGEEMTPFFVCVDHRGGKVWEKQFFELKGIIPSTVFLASKKDKILCLARSGKEMTTMIVVKLTGELEANYTIEKELNISESAVVQLENDHLILLSANPSKDENNSNQYLIRVDNTFKPVWIKMLDLENSEISCIYKSVSEEFFSAGFYETGNEHKCLAAVMADMYDAEVAKYIDEKLSLSGKLNNETRDDFRSRIGRASYDNFMTQFTSDASKDLNLFPDSDTRETASTTDITFRNVDPAKEVQLSGTYYALLIAINDYKDPSITSLDKPISDAQKLFDVLVADYLFEKANITFLKNPTREQIISSLDRMEKVITKSDNLLIFYAGHGYWNDKTQKGFWLASDASKENTANWIGNSSISDYIRSIPAKHTLLIADACFSGSIFKTRSAFGNLDKSAQKLYELTSRKAMTSGTLTEVPDKSVFIEYLIKRLSDNPENYLSSEQLFFSFKPAVLNNTDNIPQFGVVGNAGDEGGDFLFIRKKK